VTVPRGPIFASCSAAIVAGIEASREREEAAQRRWESEERFNPRTGIVRMPAVRCSYSAKPGYRRACSS
jgi:hypothetical protein